MNTEDEIISLRRENREILEELRLLKGRVEELEYEVRCLPDRYQQKESDDY